MRSLRCLPVLSEHDRLEGRLRTWAEQIGSMGGRVFYRADVASIEQAVHAAGRAHLSLYEVVTEGLLVRPFFDLEYCKLSNSARTHAADDALIVAICQSASKILAEVVNVGVQRAIVLDSSNAVKFSVHIILHLHEQHALATIKDGKTLAHQVAAILPRDLNEVQRADGQKQCIVDLAVYKRNQQFRIMGCVKHGDARVLRLHHSMTGSVALIDTLICVPMMQAGLDLCRLADPHKVPQTGTHLTAAKSDDGQAAFTAFRRIPTCWRVRFGSMSATTLLWKCGVMTCNGGCCAGTAANQGRGMVSLLICWLKDFLSQEQRERVCGSVADTLVT